MFKVTQHLQYNQSKLAGRISEFRPSNGPSMKNNFNCAGRSPAENLPENLHNAKKTFSPPSGQGKLPPPVFLLVEFSTISTKEASLQPPTDSGMPSVPRVCLLLTPLMQQLVYLHLIIYFVRRIALFRNQCLCNSFAMDNWDCIPLKYAHFMEHMIARSQSP